MPAIEYVFEAHFTFHFLIEDGEAIIKNFEVKREYILSAPL
jgi:hypothetical protein